MPAPGRLLLGRYRLDGVIARGGMATVWLGHDEVLGRRVAVKCLDAGSDPALRQRFRNEAVAAAGLAHPGVVTTFDTGEDAGTAFIVMELVEGESLRARLDRRGVLDPPEAVAIAAAVADALEHAHRQGMVHRDVKPANVLIARDGQVKVTDFGIAKATGDADLTRTGTIVGTARYLAPEQVQGLPADPRADVYALGLVLYEMLAGHSAFSGDTEMATALARLSGPPPSLANVRPGLPPELVALVGTALAPEPAHRVPSAAAFAERLRRLGLEAGQVAGTGTATALRPGAAAPAAPAAPTDPGTGFRPATAPGTGSTPTGPPTATATGPVPAPVRRARSSVGRTVALLAVLVLLGIAAAVVTTLIVGGDGGGGGGAGAAIAVTGVRDFDPYGDNRSENPDTVGRATDGDPTTIWSSETYVTRDVGGKPGVGLILELDRSASVRAVQIVGAAGADVEIRVADAPADTLDGWGPVRGTATDLAEDATVVVDPAVRGRAVLVWFTRTSPSGRIEVAEVRVR